MYAVLRKFLQEAGNGGKLPADRSDEPGTRFLIKRPTEVPNKYDEAPL